MVQVFFVMLFFPVIMNALQYYIIDSFIKDQKPQDHELLSGEDGEENDPSEDGRQDEAVHGAAEETMKDGTEVRAADKDKAQRKVDPKKGDEYDPTMDGEGSGSGGEPNSPRFRSNSESREAAVKE